MIVAGVWLLGTLGLTAWAWSLGPQTLLGLSADQVGTISVASGLVALVSILPGCQVAVGETDLPTTAKAEPDKTTDDDTDEVSDDVSDTAEGCGQLTQSASVERLGNAFLVGMLIRLAGTVALFLASSYYLDAAFLERANELPADLSDAPSIDLTSSGVTATQIAAWVLGWHLALLLTEVVALAREIQQINLNDPSC
ncbi:hypothetical protein [Neorhodopirellula pilleata]|uniref:Uncharacterized protein n=1 Tax=Neorhodopirellula pilleata TaxID=2714738 RepID=A0A5C6A368_9BACT|nr:hypothetical protein [Neorhodopirellula pilleata]TWT93698.1 hypothetical protein Pla100_42160 [Neorhodopirellula pilleata]